MCLGPAFLEHEAEAYQLHLLSLFGGIPGPIFGFHCGRVGPVHGSHYHFAFGASLPVPSKQGGEDVVAVFPSWQLSGGGTRHPPSSLHGKTVDCYHC